jgi:thymidylate synthase (FAD)
MTMHAELLQHGDLAVVIRAIRTCYDSTGKSDSVVVNGEFILGAHDTELLRRIMSSEHHSTIEHLSYTYHIEGISRGCLQELARHRIASMSVKSTRYTLGRIKKMEDLTHETAAELLVMSKITEVNTSAIRALRGLQQLARLDVPNDQLKYCLPESFKTELIWTINARSLRNFLELRLSLRAHWEIRALAEKVLSLVPSGHQVLFEGAETPIVC